MAKVRWTKDEVELISTRYSENESKETVLELVEELDGRTEQAIRSKLSSLGIYKSSEKKVAKGRVTKDMIAAVLAKRIYGSAENTQGLANANMSILKLLETVPQDVWDAIQSD